MYVVCVCSENYANECNNYPSSTGQKNPWNKWDSTLGSLICMGIVGRCKRISDSKEVF